VGFGPPGIVLPLPTRSTPNGSAHRNYRLDAQRQVAELDAVVVR